jgi:hypothetical protein
MPKENLKHAKAAETGTEIEECALIDVHRFTPKAEGGEYTPDNYGLMDPPDHMRYHGNLREREEWYENLKALVDDRRQVMRAKQKMENQMLAYRRKTDHLLPATLAWLEEEAGKLAKTLSDRSRKVEKAVKDYAKYDRLAEAALGVHGIGPITVALCITYIDLEKAKSASALWKYTGLHVKAKDRYDMKLNGGSPGNKTLRCALYCMADSQVKSRGPYRDVYDRTKARLENVTEGELVSRNTQGNWTTTTWAEAKKCHRAGAGLRAIMKHFLADYWFVGRELMGLPTRAIYAEAKNPGIHKTIMPRERGWRW